MVRPTPLVLALVAALGVVVAIGSWSALGQAMPARGAGLVLLAGAVLALVLAPRCPGPALRHPVTWWATALGLLVLGLGWTPVPDAAVFRLVERAAALATALGVGALLLRCPAGDRPAVVGAGAGLLLVVNLVGQVEVGGLPLGIQAGLGLDPPFGNTNFTTGALVPLLAVGLTAAAARPLRVLQLLGLVATLLIGIGAVNGDANRAAVVGLLVAGGVAASLRAPPRAHLPLIGAGLAVGLALATWLIVAERYPALLGPSTGFRIGCWRAALAGFLESPWIGHGPAASLEVLNRQDAYQMAWLVVPGYAEHAHSEPLELLIEGGLLLPALLGIGLALVLVPLWRRRDVPLLAGWAVAIAMGCLESHYGQPGPLLGAAVLAGLSLATLDLLQPGVSGPRLRIRGPALCAVLALAVSLAQELRWTSGSAVGHASPPVQEVLDRRRLEAAQEAQDWTAVAAIAAHLQDRVGPLTDLWFVRAEAAARLGRPEEALAHTLRQAAVNPLIPGHLDLTDRLLPLARRRGWTEGVHGLLATQDHARRLIARGRALGWHGKDARLVAWLETWADRRPPEGAQPNPNASSPSSP